VDQKRQKTVQEAQKRCKSKMLYQSVDKLPVLPENLPHGVSGADKAQIG